MRELKALLKDALSNAEAISSSTNSAISATGERNPEWQRSVDLAINAENLLWEKAASLAGQTFNSTWIPSKLRNENY